MAIQKITTDNPFDKKDQLPSWTMFNALKTGRVVPIDAVAEKLGHNVSNRTIGFFLRNAEAAGLRFKKTKDPEKGVCYQMFEGSNAKGVETISVEEGAYKAKLNGKPAKKSAAKKTAAKKSTAKKAAAKSAPKKAAAKKAAKPAAKSTPKKATPKKKGIGRGESSAPAAKAAPKAKATPKKTLGKKKVSVTKK